MDKYVFDNSNGLWYELISPADKIAIFFDIIFDRNEPVAMFDCICI